MIEASFDRSSRMSAVSGVYQYDTGQRLRMHGLPSPDELLAGDDLLSGSIVTVQVHFSYEGDEQTDMRLAQWNENGWYWMVDIPDEYLLRIDPVHVFVYVYHGANSDGERARTEYEGVFSPISRPAPGNVASEDMLERWAKLEAEVDLVLVNAYAALDNATTYAEQAMAAAASVDPALKEANDAASNADAERERLEAVERFWDGVAVQTVDLPAGSEATVTLKNNVLTYGLPRGARGEDGDDGETGMSDLEMSFSNGVLTITSK